MKKYGGKFDEPGLVLRQLATNGVVTGADGDVLGAANTAHIAAYKITVIEITKVAIFLDRSNGQKYKNIKDDLEKDLSKGRDNYPLTVEHAVHLLNTYKIKFDIKNGVNLMSNEDEVAFIERGEDGEVYEWKK